MYLDKCLEKYIHDGAVKGFKYKHYCSHGQKKRERALLIFYPEVSFMDKNTYNMFHLKKGTVRVQLVTSSSFYYIQVFVDDPTLTKKIKEKEIKNLIRKIEGLDGMPLRLNSCTCALRKDDLRKSSEECSKKHLGKG